MNEKKSDAEPNRPNLLFVLVDQMRYHAMGCAGNGQVRTPNLDRIADEGACADLAIANIPVCTPARASILTGRYPISHSVLTNNSMLPNDMPSMGKMLKNSGYATGYIGKWHLAGEAYIGATEANGGHPGWIPPGEMRHGFDYWAVHHCSHSYWDGVYYRDEPEPITIEGWKPDGQTDLAIDFIRDHASESPRDPFALVVSWGTPHTPFVAPEEFASLYDPEKFQLRQNVELEGLKKRVSNHAFPPDAEGMSSEELLRAMLRNYYGSITNIDHNVGRLLDELDDLGMGEDTIVVFTSDHGEMMGSHGHMHKVQPWDESTRVPFLLRYPNAVPAGTRVSRPFGHPDILPTLFDLMGLEQPADIEGTDFSPLFRGGEATVPDSTPLLWVCNATTWGKKWTSTNEAGAGMPPSFSREYRGVRTPTHTYVRDLTGPWMLYDNRSDPYQQNNLIESEGAGAVPPELDREVEDWLERTDDRFEETQFYIDRIELESGLATRAEEFRREGIET